MPLISISKVLTPEPADVLALPEKNSAEISRVIIVALAEATVTLYRYQALDQTLYELSPNTKLASNSSLELLGFSLLGGDKLVCKSSTTSSLIHVFGTEYINSLPGSA